MGAAASSPPPRGHYASCAGVKPDQHNHIIKPADLAAYESDSSAASLPRDIRLPQGPRELTPATIQLYSTSEAIYK